MSNTLKRPFYRGFDDSSPSKRIKNLLSSSHISMYNSEKILENASCYRFHENKDTKSGFSSKPSSTNSLNSRPVKESLIMRKKKEPIKLFPIVRSRPKSSISCSEFQFSKRGREDAVVRPENRETKAFPLTSCNDQMHNSHQTSRDSATPKSNGCPSIQFVRSNDKEAVVKNANEGAKVFPGSSLNRLSSHSGRGNKGDVVMAENKGSGRSFSFDFYADSRTGPSGIINTVISGSSERPKSLHKLSSRFGWGSKDDDVVILESERSKVFPQSSVNGRSSLFDSYANSSGSSRLIDEESASKPDEVTLIEIDDGNPGECTEEVGLEENNESKLFQATLKTLNEVTVETDVPKGILSVPLFRHQKFALSWMLEKEKGGACVGGFLADDQGLGKTISMIALIQMQRSFQEKFKSQEELFTVKHEALDLNDGEDGSISSASTEVDPEVQGMDLDDDDEDVHNIASVPAKLKREEEAADLEDGEDENAANLKPKGEPDDDVEEISQMKPAAGTLVVCPATVLRQWARELNEKVTKESKLSVLIYHGGKRTTDPIELAKHDVVLTTYAIVAMEVPKQPLIKMQGQEKNNKQKYGFSSGISSSKEEKRTSGDNGEEKSGEEGTGSGDSDCRTLAKVRWFRVILDEAHTIKNHWTKVARACCSLDAKKRWCLSGTPIQNDIDELFSYFRFFRHDPLSDYKAFVHGIKGPISKEPSSGYKNLQLVLKGLLLRRTKATLIDGKPLLSLPPKTKRLMQVNFSAEERSLYKILEENYRALFRYFCEEGTVHKNYTMIMVMLLRLRQACDHPILAKSKAPENESLKIARSLPTQKLQKLLRLVERSNAICGACSYFAENAVVTVCGHVFCSQCVPNHLKGEDTTCPKDGCQRKQSAGVIFTKDTLKKCLLDVPSYASFSSEKSPILKNNYCSSKIKAALQILQPYCKTTIPSSGTNGSMQPGNGCDVSQISKPSKAIVFSQWTSMLDLMEARIGDTIEYRRLDGTMALAVRDEAVKDFNTRPEVTVMLMSLKAGNLGLNMVAANHVILLDPWWNPTSEDQAIDRAHRIGQALPVKVTRLTVKGTIEDRILALQEEKRKMVASALGEDPSVSSATRLTTEDLRTLFNVR